MSFSWKPFFEEMLDVIVRDHDSKSLAKLMHEIFHDIQIMDKYTSKESKPIQKVDPLTFIGYFNRNNTDARKTGYCRLAKDKLGLKTGLPSDFDGIPRINPQKAWFFDFDEGSNTFTNLWNFANELNKGNVTNESFSRILEIQNVGLAKLTQICFICKPDIYLPLDSNTKTFLKANGLSKEVELVEESESFADYQSILTNVKKLFPDKNYAEISAGAYEDSGEPRHWLLGATWGDQDKSEDFIKRGVWENGYTEDTDKANSIGKAKLIKVGDQVAIKVGFVVEKKISTTGIKAIGTVLENKGDGRTLKVNWTFTGPRFDIEGASYRQTVHEVTNAEDINLIFKGTFKSIRKSINVSEETAQNNESNDMNNKVDLPLNLILYGPPGVGKTHQILKLREKFISSNSADESGKILKWTSERSWWEVIIAAVIDLNRTVSVSEIEAHPFLKAKIQQSATKTPRNTIWGMLQLHTINESTTVKFQKRSEPLVFDKTEDSKWFLTGDWKDSLADLVNELIFLKSKSPEATKRYEVVTFHQAYGYEDFIEGIRPVTSEESDSVSYTIESGVFKRISERAKADPQNAYALFIDEINRGNIAKIFGELITLIEEDKRDGESNATSTVLPYSKKEFSVPSNLYVIGTMNSVDRSIALLDMALRRRFKFQRIEPDSSLVVEKIDGTNFRSIFEKLNERISVLLGEDYQLGHSYFLKDKIKTGEDLKSVWFDNILPLFQEYFFDDWDKLKALAEPFIESTEVKGLGNLGLLNSSRHRFCARTISTNEFTSRLKKLAEILDIK